MLEINITEEFISVTIYLFNICKRDTVLIYKQEKDTLMIIGIQGTRYSHYTRPNLKFFKTKIRAKKGNGCVALKCKKKKNQFN